MQLPPPSSREPGYGGNSDPPPARVNSGRTMRPKPCAAGRSAIRDQGPPTKKRVDEAPPRPEADEGAVAVAVAEVGCLDHSLVAQVEDRDVGVAADLEPSLSLQREPLGGRGRRQPRDVRQRELSRRCNGEHRAAKRLKAGDAAPPRERIVALLQLGREQASDRTRAWRSIRLQPRPTAPRRPPAGRIGGEHFTSGADPLGILVREQEIVRARLAGDLDTPPARLCDAQRARRPCSRGRYGASTRSPPPSEIARLTASSSAIAGRDSR